MDYEQKYKEALSKCKAYIDDTEKRWSEEFSRATEKVFKEIFPELRESEDERVRKELIEFLREAYSRGNAPEECAKWLAYLEKQKEQKPAEWSEEDVLSLERVVGSLNSVKRYVRENAAMSQEYKEAVFKRIEQECSFLKSLPERFVLQSKQEWSEEDEAVRDNILRLLSCFVGSVECDSNPSLSTSYPAYMREMDWLKSLSPSWKPSEINPEEVRLLDTTISFLKDFADKGYENAVECIDWLKSKRNGTARK